MPMAMKYADYLHLKSTGASWQTSLGATPFSAGVKASKNWLIELGVMTANQEQYLMTQVQDQGRNNGNIGSRSRPRYNQ